MIKDDANVVFAFCRFAHAQSVSSRTWSLGGRRASSCLKSVISSVVMQGNTSRSVTADVSVAVWRHFLFNNFLTVFLPVWRYFLFYNFLTVFLPVWRQSCFTTFWQCFYLSDVTSCFSTFWRYFYLSDVTSCFTTFWQCFYLSDVTSCFTTFWQYFYLSDVTSFCLSPIQKCFWPASLPLLYRTS
jgi:hypothetical protein